MSVDFQSMVYLPQYDLFSRLIVITPIISQPTAPAYQARGIYDTRTVDVVALDGSIVSDQRTILDILEMEFTVMPKQNDLISIPAYESWPDAGDFEVTDSSSNGGGETTLSLHKIMVRP